MFTVRHKGARGQPENVPFADVHTLIERGDVTLYMEIDTASEEELDFLRTNLHLHHLTLEDIVHQNQRPKIDAYENYVYLAIHALAKKDGWEVEPIEVDLVLGRNWVLMCHYGPIPGLTDNPNFGERIDVGLAQGADFLLYTIVDMIVDGYFPLIDALEEEIDNLEDRLIENTNTEDLNRLLAFKRSLIHVRRAVGPQREVFNQLTRHDFHLVRKENTVYFRDVYDHLIHISEELDGLRDILAGAMEVHLSSMSNQLNVTMKKLTAWGTILVSIAAVAGIYGMNFEQMPELKWKYGYPFSLALMAAICGALYFYFKKKDYL
ncbi:MAG TPA: magnesium/cobalt transporter CorA [Verrucomicrobiae bacterium]|jgi:magnesium transporter|nr:magnesium/cobalt transporter CorA [Verrucomicrobiae bacterium]